MFWYLSEPHNHCMCSIKRADFLIVFIAFISYFCSHFYTVCFYFRVSQLFISLVLSKANQYIKNCLFYLSFIIISFLSNKFTFYNRNHEIANEISSRKMNSVMLTAVKIVEINIILQ